MSLPRRMQGLFMPLSAAVNEAPVDYGIAAEKLSTADAMIKLRDEFKCGICLDILRHPVTLPRCSHTFCHACLKTYSLDEIPRASVACVQYIETGFRCPLCRDFAVGVSDPVVIFSESSNIPLRTMLEFLHQTQDPDEEESMHP
ncbi:hypothetical protein F5Y15DRAFT_416559 [Xylariaceae sp. FL0016]|nr:hypothetical protein F5Y15DRAFT_416559 [Xylariaceae sp. FL0016]